ncbi:MAG: hypothetical protein H7A21_05535 [Spirochaetales bacterium]|nr:hypothetical protein [Spirochaetales bacterium]
MRGLPSSFDFFLVKQPPDAWGGIGFNYRKGLCQILFRDVRKQILLMSPSGLHFGTVRSGFFRLRALWW